MDAIAKRELHHTVLVHEGACVREVRRPAFKASDVRLQRSRARVVRVHVGRWTGSV
jgi:hypothetical protein